MDTAPTPRYTSHYLRLGRYIARSVLVESLGSGRYRLAPFSAELERTIFLSGHSVWSVLLAPSQRKGLPRRSRGESSRASSMSTKAGHSSFLGIEATKITKVSP